ncbi:MAG: T9SS type A sorting domain-containing protein [Bacteroidetes bacterium]|nr:T9SS type A sorting domain-containing protein [Bacteroidota bacterium]
MNCYTTLGASLLIALSFLGQKTAAQDCSVEAMATLYTATWSSEVSYTISDDNGVLAQGFGTEDYGVSMSSFCLDNISGCLVLDMVDSFGDGWNGAFLEIYLPSTGVYLGEFSLELGDAQTLVLAYGEGCEETVVDVEGCTDPGAFNYNPSATLDDGSCIDDCECEDMDDPVCAILFDGTLLTFPNLCEAFCAQAFQIVGFGDCDDLPVHGCTDPEALNYNPEADTDDGSCLYPCECDDVYEPVCAYDYVTWNYVTFNNACEANCAGAWIAWEGDCSEQPVYGCTDSEALNFNPDATNDDGSCVMLPECSESQYLISLETVSPDSLIDLGFGATLFWTLSSETGASINLVYAYDTYQQASAYGCIDPGCYNFILHDYGWAPGLGSVNVTVAGTTANYSVPEGEYSAAFALGVDAEGCELTLPGCTDPEALNYNSTATVDDGSCQYPFTCEEGTPGQLYVCTFSGGENVGLEVVADDGSVLYSQSGFGDFAIIYLDICLQDSTCYTATLTDLSGQGLGWNGGYFWVSNGYYDLIHEDLDPGQTINTVEFSLDGTCGDNPTGNDIFGCTDPGAINYNPFATYDDGSCVYVENPGFGCTDPAALNYDPNALEDDGSCIYPSICEDMEDVLLILDGGTWPSEVALFVLNDEGEILMEMDGFTGVMQGCVPAGCYTVEMHDSFGDGWNGAWAEMWVNGESVGAMTMDTGSFESQTVGIGASCDGEDNFGGQPGGYDGTVMWQPYPNPGDGEVNVLGDDFDFHEPVVVRIVDVTGKVVLETTKTRGIDTPLWTFDASSWADGMYIIRATQGTTLKQGMWMKGR